MLRLLHHGFALEVNRRMIFINEAFAVMIDKNGIRRDGRQRNTVFLCERVAEVINFNLFHGCGVCTDRLSHSNAVAGQRRCAGSRTTDPVRCVAFEEFRARGESACSNDHRFTQNFVFSFRSRDFNADGFSMIRQNFCDFAVEAIRNTLFFDFGFQCLHDVRPGSASVFSDVEVLVFLEPAEGNAKLL